MKNIGIVCEGPTDYIIMREVVDRITGEDHYYVQLQPEPDLLGRYGNGWKGVWKWCVDNAAVKDKLMKDIEPSLDLLIIQMDGDVSRKEKAAHCWCTATACKDKGVYNPIECDVKKETREQCPVVLPCADHDWTVAGYIKHLEHLIECLLKDLKNVCVVIPCDSIEAWVIAAYDEDEKAEEIEDSWMNVISKKKYYHNIRISGDKKRKVVYEQLARMVCSNWEKVTDLCLSAKKFEEDIRNCIQNERTG